MGGRRRFRFEKLTVSDAEELIPHALQLRESIIAAQTRLRPFGEQYTVLLEIGEQLDRMLETIAGKPLNHRVGGLGLLPLT